ncbi:MAG: hypothetical protein ABSD20_14575 [Terriglobales bacterium]|jgi:hypothetical protein
MKHPPAKNSAVVFAEARLDAAVLSVKDKGWPRRVDQAALALLDACERSEAAVADVRDSRNMAARRRAIEERDVAVLEAKEQRLQAEYDAKHPQRKGPVTIDDINEIRRRIFGLPTIQEEQEQAKLLQEKNAKALAEHDESLRVGRSFPAQEPAAAGVTSAANQAAANAADMKRAKSAVPAAQPSARLDPPVLPSGAVAGQGNSRFPGECLSSDRSAFFPEDARNDEPRWPRRR